jgi:carbamoyltransferase
VGEYFSDGVKSPFMTLTFDVRKEKQSQIASITHVDGTARIQTVSRETNPRFWGLINEFKTQTGYGVIVNTSFNVRGEPVVCTPDQAYRCFMRTEMDYLVVGNYVFDKRTQPALEESGDWRTEFKLD